MRASHLLDPEFSSATTAALSDWNRTDLFDHNSPQVATAITIGIISLIEMWQSIIEVGHCSWNQRSCSYAPHPQEPEASDVIITSGCWTAIHCEENVDHHLISERADLFTRMKPSN